MNWKLILKSIGKIIVAAFVAVALLYRFIISSLLMAFKYPNIELIIFVLAVMTILIEVCVIALLWGFLKKKAFYIPVCIILGICIITGGAILGYQKYHDSIPTIEERGNLLLSYAPYEENSKVATLGEESELLLKENLPVMDGATALYPIYSAFAKAVYPKELIEDFKSDYLMCSTTTEAYYNIVTGDADIIFAALPSEEQKQFAKENNVELVYTPIGKEAFVFFVNSKNPIEDISVPEIQDVYSGKISHWKELGVESFGKIKAFQRDKGSGSQSTLEKLMAGKNLVEPLKEDVIDGMGGIIKKTADYKNYKNALGYSFRFYSTEMVKNNEIKLLSVNGVYPSLENIENGTYPLASYFYAVTRKDSGENVEKLLGWITGKQGQRIIEKTGYTPLEK